MILCEDTEQTMKKLLPLFCALGCFPQAALADNKINTLQNLGQGEFRSFSEDLGSALSYKPLTPAAPLGVIGFDVGLELTATDMERSSSLWAKASGSSLDTLVVPRLHVAKGLPFNLDVAAFVSTIPTTNLTLIGADLRYAILEGGVTMPAVGVRGAFTRLSGVDQLALNTESLDVSISKGFAMFTPYAGFGQVWVNSTPHGVPLSAEKFSLSKVFLGGNVNMGLVNVALEFDKTGVARSYSGKLGFRF
jgi:hypothetical protein